MDALRIFISLGKDTQGTREARNSALLARQQSRISVLPQASTQLPLYESAQRRATSASLVWIFRSAADIAAISCLRFFNSATCCLSSWICAS